MTSPQSQTLSAPSEKTLKGWHVLLIMLGFFGIMFAVNGVFLYHAITSFPGEDIKKSYVQGLNYNDTLAARAAQAELGWQAEAGLEGRTLVFRLFDADDQPLSAVSVIGELRRAATRQADRALVFENQYDGSYTVDVGDLNKGQWDLRVVVYDEQIETRLFNVEKTLTVQ
ncbi:MAG: FixH family protein [Pseudomonadota bacterium]